MPDLDTRPVPDHLGDHEDESTEFPGRWVDSQYLCPGDTIVCLDGQRRTLGNVRLSYVEAQRVCNLTIDTHHSYAVGELGILVHNSWCGILKRVAEKPPKLVELAIKKGYTAAAVHGHHIVMKASMLLDAIEARRLMKLYKVDLLDTEKDLRAAVTAAKKAKKAGIISADEVRDQLANVCYALNHADEIHSKKYAAAVLKRIEAAVEVGKSNAKLDKLHPNSNAYKEKVAVEIKKALGKMREKLEKGDDFWNKE